MANGFATVHFLLANLPYGAAPVKKSNSDLRPPLGGSETKRMDCTGGQHLLPATEKQAAPHQPASGVIREGSIATNRTWPARLASKLFTARPTALSVWGKIN